jgi:hypothetical protein
LLPETSRLLCYFDGSFSTRVSVGCRLRSFSQRLIRPRARLVDIRRCATTTPNDIPHPFPCSICQITQQVARTAAFAVRVFSLAIIATVPYSILVSKLRRPFLADRYFFIAVRLLRRREQLTEPDFALLARAFNRARALHPFFLTAWVFLPDHWHCICASVHPLTISMAMK